MPWFLVKTPWGDISQRLPVFSSRLPTCWGHCPQTLFVQYLSSERKHQLLESFAKNFGETIKNYDWLTVETIDQSKLTVVTQTIPVVLGPETSEEATKRFISGHNWEGK